MAKNDKPSPKGNYKKRDFPICKFCNTRFLNAYDLSVHEKFCPDAIKENFRIREARKEHDAEECEE